MHGMALSWLSKILSSLLFSTLVGLTVLLVLSSTVLSSSYVTGKMDQTNAYEKLSQALSEEVAKKAEVADPAVQKQVAKIITPAVLKEKITTTLSQLEDYYKHGGNAPVLDLTDLVAQARTAGLEVPEHSQLEKPIVFGGGQDHGSGSVGLAQRVLIITASVLAFLLAILCWRRRTVVPFANLAIALGGFLLFIGLLVWLLPGLVDANLQLGTASNAVAVIAHDIVFTIARDIGKDFVFIGLGVAALGLGGRIAIAKLRRPHRA